MKAGSVKDKKTKEALKKALQSLDGLQMTSQDHPASGVKGRDSRRAERA